MNPHLKASEDGMAVLCRGIFIELPKPVSQFENLEPDCEYCFKIAECLTSSDRSLYCETADKQEAVVL